MTISPTTIARALSETHRAATAVKRAAVESHRAQIEALKVKEDQAFDLLTDKTLDREAYRRQVERIRAERDALFEKLDAAQREADDAYLVTADRVLELAKNARTLWETRTPLERRDLLSRMVCNLHLDGRTVEYQLQKPFAALTRLRSEIETMAPEPQRASTLPSRPVLTWRGCKVQRGDPSGN